ncbi:MAG TPA: enoyl-CoA hydratase-related protein, partial [Alphaproteobacteria bacterium]|nr:enoyl-CoA hydratase-related protein [Alphaproteobacteria bacterium]
LGKSLTKTQAMDICLTGRLFKACEALELGIISKIFPKEALLGHAKEMAKSLALRDLKALQRIKAAVLKAHETPLCQGVRFERELFYSQLKSETGKQGITDFFAKKKK